MKFLKYLNELKQGQRCMTELIQDIELCEDIEYVKPVPSVAGIDIKVGLPMKVDDIELYFGGLSHNLGMVKGQSIKFLLRASK